LTASQHLLSGGNRINEVAQVTATGSGYTLTTTPAAVVFGTISPVLTIPAAGTWLLVGTIRVDASGATFAAFQTVTSTLRRTNNTAANLKSAVQLLPISTTNTASRLLVTDHIYTTTNSNDSVTWFSSVTVLPSAGSVLIGEASIFAYRLY